MQTNKILYICSMVETEKEILAFYQRKLIALNTETRNVEYLIYQLKERIDQSEKQEELLGSGTKDVAVLYSQMLNQVPIGYYKEMTYGQKLRYILNILKEASVQQILDYIMELENVSDKQYKKRVFLGLTITASRQNIKGEIYSIKDGKRNIYSLTPFVRNALEKLGDDDAPI